MVQEKIAVLLVRYRLPLAIATILAVAICALGSTNLSFNNNYRALFKEDNPQLEAFDKLNASYNETDSVVFLLSPPNGNVFTKQSLLIIEDLAKKAQQIPYSLAVHSINNFQRSIPKGENEFAVDYLVPNAADLSLQQIEDIKQFVLNEALIADRLVSSSGKVAALFVNIALPEDRFQGISETSAYARQLKQTLQQQYPGLIVHLSGGVILSDSFVQVALHDGIQLFPIMVILGLVIQGLLFRSFSAVVVSVGVIFLSIVFTLGIAGWLNYSLNQTSILAPLLVLTLALADTTHVITEYLTLRRLGHENHRALELSLSDNLQPIFLTSITTAIGLLCMNFSDSPPFHDFANITSIGVMAAFLFTLSLLPALILAMPITVSEQDLNLTKFMRALSRFSIAHRKIIAVLTILIVATSCYFIPQNKLNDDLIDYFDESLEIRQAADFALEHLKGVQSIHYSFESGQPHGINEPKFLQQIEKFSQWYQQQAEVEQVVSYLDTVKNLNQNMHQGDPSWHRIPQTRPLAAQYLFLYELSLQPGLDLNDQLDIDRSALKVTVLTRKLNNQELIALEQRANRWLQQQLPNIEYVGASQSLMFAHLGNQVIHSMVEGSIAALLLITVLLIIGLRSLRYGLLSLIPNVFPAAVIYGLWGMLVGEINQAAAVTISVSLGVVVDDTVHILSKYIYARKRNASVEQALEYAFTTARLALIITSIVLTTGLLVLAQSVFGINAIIGAMVAPIIMLALVIDLLFLPVVLYYFDQFLNKNNRPSNTEFIHLFEQSAPSSLAAKQKI